MAYGTVLGRNICFNIKATHLGDNLLYSHPLCVWWGSNIIGRIYNYYQLLVTIGLKVLSTLCHPPPKSSCGVIGRGIITNTSPMKNCAKNSAQEKRVELFYSTFSRKEVNDSALKFKIQGILFMRMIYCSVSDTGMLGKGNPRIQELLTGIKPTTFQLPYQ